MLADLLDRYASKDRRALARLLTLASRGEGFDEIDRFLAAREQGASHAISPVIAVTGSAGVGKSTFLGRLVAHVRQSGKTAAVLACDPQSPLTGGALLGDVFRMAGGADDGLFLRSLATPGGRGGVADNVPLMLRLLTGYGFDVLFVETVGSGQGDVAVGDFADVVVLLTQPHTGDELQWEKAGILEIADAIVVHKADLPGAEQTAAQMRDVLSPQPTPILLASSITGRGFVEVWRTIELLAQAK
jgi:LAO/AO transport system kinase